MQQEKDAATKAQADANDVSKGKYGDSPIIGTAGYVARTEQRTQLAELAKLEEGARVWIRVRAANVRSQSAKLAFLNFRDSSVSIQAVLAATETKSRQFVKFAAGVPVESIVDVIGTVRGVEVPIASATLSNIELHIEELWVISRARVQLPISVADANSRIPAEGATEVTADGRPAVGLQSRLDNRVIDLRSPLSQAIFEIRDGVELLFEQYLRKNGFKKRTTPKLLGAPSEGGANVFKVGYFEREAFLAQSPQFYKQMLIAADFKRVFEVGPVFRAENSNTSRHLTEYTSLDFEMEFSEDYQEVIHFGRDLLFFMLSGLKEQYSTETEFVRSIYDTQELLLPATSEEVPIIKFAEGIEMLKAAGVSISGDEDIKYVHSRYCRNAMLIFCFSSTDEKHLGNLVREKYKSDFYILTEYPLEARAFYSMPHKQNPKLSHSYDFMLRGQEVLSGAQRIHNAELLKEQMKLRGMIPEGKGFKHYVEAFEFGCAPHAGGAFGAERIVLNWLGLGNVRLASLFPRDPSRLDP